MATSSAMSTTNTYIKYSIECIQNSQSISGNTSNVTVKVRVWRTNTGYTTYGNGTVYCKINGTTYSAGITSSQSITSSGIELFSKTLDIAHNSDGSKSLVMSAWISHDRFSSSEQSYTQTLTTIPRASSFTMSSNNVNAGTGITINITRATSSFTHDIYFIFGTRQYLIGKGIATSTSYTIPLEAIDQIPSSVQGYGSIVVYTLNGTSLIGSNTQRIYVNVPSNIIPTFDSFDITRIDNGVPSSWGVYVNHKSKLNYNINNPKSYYGATISSYRVTGGGGTWTAQSTTTGEIHQSGEVTFTATITDTRGRTASKSKTIYVYDYEYPQFTNCTATRCDKNGKLNDEGSYALVKADISYSSVNGNNDPCVGIEVRWKKQEESTWSAWTQIAKGQTVIVGDGEISPDYEFEFEVQGYDYFTTANKIFILPTAEVTMDFLAGGKGMAIGKVAETEGLEIDWNTTFNKPVNINAGLLLNGIDIDTSTVTTGDNGRQVSIRYSNGIQVNIIKFVTDTLSFNATWGSLYTCGQQNTLPSYIEIFSEVPTVIKSVEEGGGNNAFISSSNKATTSHPGAFELIRGTGGVSNTFIIDVISIGRWK